MMNIPKIDHKHCKEERCWEQGVNKWDQEKIKKCDGKTNYKATAARNWEGAKTLFHPIGMTLEIIKNVKEHQHGLGRLFVGALYLTAFPIMGAKDLCETGYYGAAAGIQAGYKALVD